MSIPPNPCYRLDPHTLQRIEIVDIKKQTTLFETVDPDFEYLYIEPEIDTLNNIIGNRQEDM